MTLSFFADGVEDLANRSRIADAARLLGATCVAEVAGHLIALENIRGARSIYGRTPIRKATTISVGNERRGLSPLTLQRADETLVIPTLSRTVKTLNVAAAAAVAGWYVLRGSAPQPIAARPAHRRPSLLIIGNDHVEVGSTLRSAAAFGFQDVLLDDGGSGWFTGPAGSRREARAAARRHKNPLRVHRADLRIAARFDDVLFVTASGKGTPLQRERLVRGQRQLVIVSDDDALFARLPRASRIATLELVRLDRTPLRLIASIALAETARQVGRRRPTLGVPAPRAPTYEVALDLAMPGEARDIDASELLEF